MVRLRARLSRPQHGAYGRGETAADEKTSVIVGAFAKLRHGMRPSLLVRCFLLLLVGACSRPLERRDSATQAPAAAATSAGSARPSNANVGGAVEVQSPLASPSSRMTAVPVGPVKRISMGNGHLCAVMADDSLASCPTGAIHCRRRDRTYGPAKYRVQRPYGQNHRLLGVWRLMLKRS